MATGSTGGDDYTIIPVIEITSIKQVIVINVEPFSSSQLYTESGPTRLDTGASITIEDNRVDIKQLNNLANQKLISYTRYNKKVSG
jgi:hypothetical protein